MAAMLDTSATFFVEFWTSAADATNGCPSVGIIDAAQAPLDDDKFSQDLSRPDCPSETLGISCNPYSGTVHVSNNTSFTKKLEDKLCKSCEKQALPPKSFCTTLNWETYEALTLGSERFSIWSGLLISGGTLEFFRKGPLGLERSGTICECLPSKVLCCAFMFDFCGEAQVSAEVCLDDFPEVCSCSKGVELVDWNPWPQP
jgi:hypothetical protein